jgi:hypothetical protein
MKSKSNTAEVVKESFKVGWENLPAKAQVPLRESIVSSCGWRSLTSFYNKMNGVHKISPLEITVIESQFRVYGINPWTGLPFFDENF